MKSITQQRPTEIRGALLLSAYFSLFLFSSFPKIESVVGIFRQTQQNFKVRLASPIAGIGLLAAMQVVGDHSLCYAFIPPQFL